MVSERNRILNLIEYVKSLGIEVNYGKNKARGNKGFFKAKVDNFRIDIAQDLSDEEALRVLVHEFSHYIHFKHDKTLKSLDFIIQDINNELWGELITLTVDAIPKETIKPLFELQNSLMSEIKLLKTNFLNLNILKLQQKQKYLKKVNAKIARINRYYNNATELFARSIEQFFINPDAFKIIAPLLSRYYYRFLDEKKDNEFNEFYSLMLK